MKKLEHLQSDKISKFNKKKLEKFDVVLFERNLRINFNFRKEKAFINWKTKWK